MPKTNPGRVQKLNERKMLVKHKSKLCKEDTYIHINKLTKHAHIRPRKETFVSEARTHSYVKSVLCIRLILAPFF